MKKELKRELRHLYGAAILFFYYLKLPLLIGIPILYIFLDYERNIFLDILWLISLFLILKDIFVLLKRFKNGEKLWR
ncbi:hypothetical protein [Nitrosophilus labii]|uniref:hypothetical protein n=1 Tax=Nitrosophilus labii TaxID=2706014 RepID=UPI001656B704|nr:hypothetical protein [Nitrosophilus labii]